MYCLDVVSIVDTVLDEAELLTEEYGTDVVE
jgi:hypothetical protein